MPTEPISRRSVLVAASAAALSPGVFAQPAQLQVKSLADALKWLDALAAAPKAKTSQGWPLPQVLEHLAQSIEFSVSGFPQPKSVLFQNTVGSAAFAVFKWRGKMSHGLTEAIPGAAALAATELATASARLRAAIQAFEAHSAALKPHFAYGALSKGDYALAHSFHIANHQDWVVLA
jgi:hypothetical protein